MADYTLVERVDEAMLRRVGRWFADADPRIDADALLPARDDWPDTLMPRIAHVADVLQATLPDDWLPVVARVVQALPEGAQTDLGFDVWPLFELLGRGTADRDAALAVLRDLGAKAYAEKGVRPHLLADLPGTLAVLRTWVDDPRPGVRRLAAESCRPRLPWAPVLRPLLADPTPTWPILRALRDDPDHLTRNAVANHLNDVTRDHPDLVVAEMSQWLDTPATATQARTWIAERALRSLTRAGHPGALSVLGRGPVEVRARLTLDPPTVAIGQRTRMAATVTTTESRVRQVAVEVAVHYLRASGGRSRKVFSWWRGTLEPGQTWEGTRRHAFADLSTRSHHPGDHPVDLLVNGVVVDSGMVTLQPQDPPGP